MNIFQVLSQGKGRLNEENLSAMLGFLLNPEQSHGLKDLFLKRFLSMINEVSGVDYMNVFNSNYKFDITLESPYEVNSTKKYIDLDLKFFVDGKEVIRVLVENKIKPGAAKKDQFKEEYLGVLNSLEEDSKELKVLMLLLTPESTSPLLREEYEELSSELLQINHNKVWLYWNAKDKNPSIVQELKKIILQEATVEIDPISEYVRHTIKALIRHIIDSQNISDLEKRYNPISNDEIIQEVEIKLNEISYRIEQYRSSAIKIFNLEKEEYEIAKKLLREVNEVYNLGIDIIGKNTRSLGKDILKELKNM